MKALLGAFNLDKALVGDLLRLRDCEMFGNLRITFVSSSNVDCVRARPGGQTAQQPAQEGPEHRHDAHPPRSRLRLLQQLQDRHQPVRGHRFYL